MVLSGLKILFVAKIPDFGYLVRLYLGRQRRICHGGQFFTPTPNDTHF